MWILKFAVLTVLSIVTISGKPFSRSRYENQTVVHEGSPVLKECREAAERETCSAIFQDAISSESRFRGFPHFFDHYCRKIPGFVPCLQKNKEDYMTMGRCGAAHEIMIFEQVMTLDEVWDMSINFLDTVNDIVCSRKDEAIDLAECIEQNDNAVRQQMMMCVMEHITPLMHMMEPLALDPSFYCAPMYGAASCIVDGLSTICTDSSDLLDTVYDDLIVGVLGSAAGCEEEPNPVENFIRSVREKLRR